MRLEFAERFCGEQTFPGGNDPDEFPFCLERQNFADIEEKVIIPASAYDFSSRWKRRGSRGLRESGRVFGQLPPISLQRAGPLERPLQPVRTDRLQQVINRASLEGFDRMLIVGGEND